jgi:hypothetical protein
VAVQDVSFAVEEGEIFGILGPSRHGRHPGGRLVDRTLLARQAQQRLLRDVLGLRDAAEHPVRDAEAASPQHLDLLVSMRHGSRAHHPNVRRAAGLAVYGAMRCPARRSRYQRAP